MALRILLVNPPIYDFAAYDFWLKPYGLLSVAGFLRSKADFTLFDYLDRKHPYMAEQAECVSDQWGRGRFFFEKITAPQCLAPIPRYYRRFGLPRNTFQEILATEVPFDYAFIQTMMTYWYQGIQEVIEDIRTLQPKTKIILGGNYVTLCPTHANTLEADFILPGTNLKPLWEYIGVDSDMNQSAFWEAYDMINVGVLKLSEGCPFECTYCSVPKVYGKFRARSMERSLNELDLLIKLGVKNITFYDDALLFRAEDVLVPFLKEVIRRGIKVNFHSPNALNARFLTKKLAELMVTAGFKTFYLGFESVSAKWHEITGSKVLSNELAHAVEYLVSAGAEPINITAYQLLGHPHSKIQQIETSMRFVNSLGIRGMLADFSPIPGTPDGEYCRRWIDMDEPLMHNKTAFPIILMGFEKTNQLKDLQRQLNRQITPRQ